MAPLISLDDPDYAAEIAGEIERLRISDALGRSRNLPALFEYLLERSRCNNPPREIEIAQDVFFRSGEAGLEDGISRVYVHRLRRRLKEHYAKNPPRAIRIDLPRGEYRLVASVSHSARPLPEPGHFAENRSVLPRTPRPWWGPVLWVSLGAALMLAVWAASVWVNTGQSSPVGPAAASPVWSGLLSDNRPILLVEGDYYLFGQYDKDLGISRLIHDFSIGSRDELNSYLLMHPADVGLYGDVGLSYLPLSVAYAQEQLEGILERAPALEVVPASSLTPGALTTRNIVYIGLTSGFGLLAEPIFAGSRFQTGTSYDEIRDAVTRKTYFGQSGMTNGAGPRRQYGLLSVFPGPKGNRYVVIAGTGEMALRGMAQSMADPTALKALGSVSGRGSFEALYEIDGQSTVVNSVRLVAVSSRDATRIWQPTNRPIMP